MQINNFLYSQRLCYLCRKDVYFFKIFAIYSRQLFYQQAIIIVYISGTEYAKTKTLCVAGFNNSAKLMHRPHCALREMRLVRGVTRLSNVL